MCSAHSLRLQRNDFQYTIGLRTNRMPEITCYRKVFTVCRPVFIFHLVQLYVVWASGPAQPLLE
jgi:hypothetical protein